MKIEKVEKLVVNLHDKTEYVIHIKNVKQALNHELVSKKIDRVIKVNQNARRKSYIDMNKDLRKKSQKWFWNFFFFKMMNNTVFRKAMERWENMELLNLPQQKEGII